MTTREAFEVWCETILRDNPNWRESGDAELGWQAWQTATDAALERAAKACQNVARKQGTIARQLAAMECGEVVRALKDEK